MHLFVDPHLPGTSPSLVQAVRLIKRFTSCDATVLLQGNTGTGKGVAARAIHPLGAGCPFAPADHGAILEPSMEIELLGAARGPFTVVPIRPRQVLLKRLGSALADLSRTIGRRIGVLE